MFLNPLAAAKDIGSKVPRYLAYPSQVYRIHFSVAIHAPTCFFQPSFHHGQRRENVSIRLTQAKGRVLIPPLHMCVDNKSGIISDGRDSKGSKPEPPGGPFRTRLDDDRDCTT